MIHRLTVVGLLLLPLAPARENLFIQTPPPTYEGDRTQVEVAALFSVAPPTGYLPVRVTVRNERNREGVARLETSSQIGQGARSHLVESEREIRAPAGRTTSSDLLVPVATRFKNFGFFDQGTDILLSGNFGRSRGGIRTQFDPGGPAVLMSEPLFTPNSSMLDAEVNRRSSGFTRSNQVFAARFSPADLPDDWRAYAGYDVMLLTDADWRQAPPGARAAILQWVRLGGRLDFHATGPTTLGSLGIQTPAADPAAPSAGRPYGFGQVGLLRHPTGSTGSLKLDPAATVRRYHSTTQPYLIRSIQNDYSARWPLQDTFGNQNFGYATFIVLLVAFGILVGPINLFVFAKSGQRHRLFVTTPIIALGTCALLLGLILLRDGLGGRGSRLALIEIRPDAGENRAYILQEQISRTGVLLGGKFTTSEEAAITPVPIAESPWARLTPARGGAGMRLTLAPRKRGLEVRGDMFQSRSEQAQLVRAVVPTRGRIEIENPDGPPRFISSFQFAIETLHYCDPQGGCWKAKNLTAGEPVTARQISEGDYQQAVTSLRNRFGTRHGNLLQAASKRPDHYVATTSTPPTVATFDAIRWTSDQAILTGPVVR
jgi:hypothetical protein